MESERDDAKESKKNVPMTKGELITFAYDVGFSIIVPLIILMIIGKILDTKFETSPLFLIVGLVLSLITTGVAIYKKTKSFL